jgi:hypothetical protein
MKRLIALVTTVLALFVAVPASAHHMAADIVSDEIYEMINDLLEEAESPHLYLDFTSIPGMVETTVTVPSGMVDDILDGIESYGALDIYVQVSEEQGGWVTIIIQEPMGDGARQMP